MTELEDLEFLSKKSNEFIDKQVSAYRQKHANSGVVIAVIAIFIPFFLNGLDKAFLSIKILSILPIAFFIYAIKLFLKVLEAKSLDQGFHPKKFDELASYRSYEKVLLFEIGANRSSYESNTIITGNASKCFKRAINLTLYAVIISICILVFNIFIHL